MNKQMALSLVSLTISVCSFLPAQASESDDHFVKTVKAPMTVSALFAGMAIGTPIAVMHDTVTDIYSARDSIASQFGGQQPDACQYLVADFMAVPAGLAMGLIDGAYHGVSNAVNNCSEKPFSAESFCLKESCYEDNSK